jgi:hypothetical protein
LQTYRLFLQSCVNEIGSMDVETINTDYELAELRASKEVFQDAVRAGCSFHAKQTWFRKMKALKIPQKQIWLAMRHGNIDALSLVRPDQFNSTIAYLNTILNPDNLDSWIQFWSYFESTWISGSIPLESWNLSVIDGEVRNYMHRSNGALERYNETMNAMFASSHPNIFALINGICDSSLGYVRRLKDQDTGHERLPEQEWRLFALNAELTRILEKPLG